MKKINLLKMSTCVIGLGMMLSGINSMAMEERYEKISAGIEESKRAAFEEVYNQELALGKSELFAGYYAKLIVVDGIDKGQAELRAKILERHMTTSRDGREFSEDYAKLVADGYKKAEAELEIKARLRIKTNEPVEENSEERFPYNSRLFTDNMPFDSTKGLRFIPIELLEDKSILKVTKRDLIEGSGNFYTRFFKTMINMGLDSSEIEREIKNGKTNIYAFHYLKKKFKSIFNSLFDDENRKEAEELENKVKSDEDFAYFLIESLNKVEEYDKALKQAEVAYGKFKEGHSKRNSLYYAELITQGVHPRRADKGIRTFERLIEEGESETYAYLYSYYVIKYGIDFEYFLNGYVEPVILDCTEEAKLTAIAEKEILSGKGSAYAVHYTDLIIEGIDEAEARKRAEFFELGRKKYVGSKSDRFMRIYAYLMYKGMNELEASKVAEIAEEKIVRKHLDEGCAICYAKLLYYGISEEKADTMYLDIKSMLDSGKSEAYVRFYSELYARGTNAFDIERQATMAEREVINGRSYDYALNYSELIVNGLSESEAREATERFEQRIKEEKSKTFLEFLSRSTEQKLNANAAMRQAAIAEEKLKEGYSKEASLYYAELITSGLRINKAMRQLEIFEEQMKIGKGDLYARFFARSIGDGLDVGTARRQAEIAEKLFFEKYIKSDGIVLMYRDYVNYDTATGKVRVSEKLLDVLRRERIHKDIEEFVKDLKYTYYKHYVRAKFLSFYHAEWLVSGMNECDAEKRSKEFTSGFRIVGSCFC